MVSSSSHLQIYIPREFFFAPLDSRLVLLLPVIAGQLPYAGAD